jgi:hypothetical protein
MEKHFGVAVGGKAVTHRFEFAAELPVIVDFAVKNEHRSAVFGGNRLIAAVKIDDLEAHGSEGDKRVFVCTVLVWAAVAERSGRYSNARKIPFTVAMSKAGYATQIVQCSLP